MNKRVNNRIPNAKVKIKFSQSRLKQKHKIRNSIKAVAAFCFSNLVSILNKIQTNKKLKDSNRNINNEEYKGTKYFVIY